MLRRYSGYYPPDYPEHRPPPQPPRPMPPPPPRPPFDLDMGDIVLLGLLYYLYRESRDEEFLIILIILAAKIFNIQSYFSDSSSPLSSLLGSFGL